MYINQRYYSNLYELNNEIIELRKDIALTKIKNLFQEIDQLLNNEEINFLKRNFKINKLLDIFTLEKQQVLEILNGKELNEFISKYKSTSKNGLD